MSNAGPDVGPSLRCDIVRERFGRVKGPLAALAAGAPLTRPMRSQGTGNYRNDAGLRRPASGIEFARGHC